jgi:hypothetical protein
MTLLRPETADRFGLLHYTREFGGPSMGTPGIHPIDIVQYHDILYRL